MKCKDTCSVWTGHRSQGPLQTKVTQSVHAQDRPTTSNPGLLIPKKGPGWPTGKDQSQQKWQSGWTGEEGKHGRRWGRLSQQWHCLATCLADTQEPATAHSTFHGTSTGSSAPQLLLPVSQLVSAVLMLRKRNAFCPKAVWAKGSKFAMTYFSIYRMIFCQDIQFIGSVKIFSSSLIQTDTKYN